MAELPRDTADEAQPTVTSPQSEETKSPAEASSAGITSDSGTPLSDESDSDTPSPSPAIEEASETTPDETVSTDTASSAPHSAEEEATPTTHTTDAAPSGEKRDAPPPAPMSVPETPAPESERAPTSADTPQDRQPAPTPTPAPAAPAEATPTPTPPATAPVAATPAPASAPPAPAPAPAPVAATPAPAPTPAGPAQPATDPSQATAAPEVTVPEPSAPTKSFPKILIRNRFEIDPDIPLPHLNMPVAKAYQAVDNREPSRNLFALICTPGIPIRTRNMAALKRQSFPGMMPLVDFLPIQWDMLGQRCMAVIYERPMGGRFLDAFPLGTKKTNEYEVTRNIITPLSLGIRELSRLDTAHRNIRLENLYYMDKNRTDLVLGDCTTTPPGYNQPAIYEPVERGMAMPAGRGLGTSGDDLYALAVLSIFILLGKNPLEGHSDDEMLSLKLELGSYQALCGRQRLPLSMIEPLRGMLNDDPSERWTVTDLDNWVNGKKSTPAQRKAPLKPKTPFNFGGRDHTSHLTLVLVFRKNVTEAAKVIKSGVVSEWIRKSLSLLDIADLIDTAVIKSKAAEGTPDGSDDFLVTRVCTVLNPSAPLSYKGISFLPDALGAVLAIDFLRNGNAQIPAEIVARALMGLWFIAQDGVGHDNPEQKKNYKTLTSFMKINEMGYGAERCLYELNATLPCQSELVVKNYVEDVEDLLPALDDIANKTDPKDRPIDRHITAFVAARFKKQDIGPHLKAIGSNDETTSIVGVISLYALLQWRLNTGALLGLSSWIGGQLGPATKIYKSRSTRREIERQIPSLVRKGSLPDLLYLIDNADTKKQDAADFGEARIAFQEAEEEIIKAQGGIEGNKDEANQKRSEHVTTLFTIFLTLAICTLIVLMETW